MTKRESSDPRRPACEGKHVPAKLNQRCGTCGAAGQANSDDND